ncbi:hypothetical protein [Adlercreutzia sp.]|jgi:hypothetical protein|uniref:hypothetical protein n=1 Tax=Adlercreutzia sp. TaxID=1872387 RepID=UPI003AAC9E58|nr:hypothetical protein [Adlercreutzia rubneri]
MQDHDRKNDAGMSRFVPRADRHGVALSTALASHSRKQGFLIDGLNHASLTLSSIN